MDSVFGFIELKKKAPPVLKSFDIETDEATTLIESPAEGGVISFSHDPSVNSTDENQLIKAYRVLSNAPEIDQAINEIVNESFVFDVHEKKALEISFSENSITNISASIKKKITAEFDIVYDLVDFKKRGLDLYRKWYIDGKIYFLKVIEATNTKNGIVKLIRIDPTKMKKVTEVPKKDKDGILDLSKIKHYYVFSDNYSSNNYHIQRGMKVNVDSIVYCDSGLKDEESGQNISYLHKAMVPYNNLRLMEDSLLIYRVARAPERRAFYVDVGKLPKLKAEEYLRSLMNRFKTKLVYDSKTGTILDKKNVLSMVEDFWLPRREGKGTEIQTLPGAENLGVVQDVNYFKKKMYQSLNVPLSRFDEEKESTFPFGRTVEINREEYRFKKYIDKLRSRFATIFEDILKTQLILKNVITMEDWDDIKKSIEWIFTEDNYFVEYKEQELLNSRLAVLMQIDPFVDKYFTKDWVLENVLKYSEKEMKQLEKDLPDPSTLPPEKGGPPLVPNDPRGAKPPQGPNFPDADGQLTSENQR